MPVYIVMWCSSFFYMTNLVLLNVGLLVLIVKIH